MSVYSIPFSFRDPFKISFRPRSVIRMRATGGEPAEKLLLFPAGLDFGIHADSVAGSAEIQSGLALYGRSFDFGMRISGGNLSLGSGKILQYTDPKTLSELDEMTLDTIPFE